MLLQFEPKRSDGRTRDQELKSITVGKGTACCQRSQQGGTDGNHRLVECGRCFRSKLGKNAIAADDGTSSEPQQCLQWSRPIGLRRQQVVDNRHARLSTRLRKQRMGRKLVDLLP